MDWLTDLRLSVRSLRNSPGFAIVAVTMLAVGIGVNATVFTVTNAVLFKGFALVPRNDRLVYISNGGCCASFGDYLDFRTEAQSFQGMGVTHGIGLVLQDTGGYAEHVEATEVTADVFKLTGQAPIIGRDFTPADEVDGAPSVAMLHYGFWERRFGKDPGVVGRAVRLNGKSATIVGIMPRGYSFPQSVDVWVPLVQTEAVRRHENRNTWFAFGRLRDGASLEGARAEIQGIASRLAAEFPIATPQPTVIGPFHEFFIGPNASVIYGSMWGAEGFVLLIACANHANLLLARALGRSREISVRLALGAGRWRIIRQLLVESVLLSSIGGLLGWWIAKVAVRAYELAMSQKSSWLILDYTMDGRVLAYLIGLSVATGLLFGLAPALQLSRLDVNASLKDGGRGATLGGRGKHLSSILVTVEMALAVVLLAGAGVMIRSFLKAHNADMGVHIENLLGASLSPSQGRYEEPEQRIAYFDRAQARLAGLPGVEAVALAESLPSWGSDKRPFELAGAPPTDDRRRPELSVLKISPNYLRTIGAQLLVGRDFSDADTASSPAVVLVNELFARRSWPGQNALGQRLRLFTGAQPGDWMTVVGVTSNIVQNDQTRQRVDPVVYQSYRQNPPGSMVLMARTRFPPASLISAFRRELQTLDPDLPIFGPWVVADRLESWWDSRFYGMLFLIFAGIALLLASVGLYTVIAHSVRQRTQEIGIRTALGATARDIFSLVLREGMLPLAVGLAVGLTGSFFVNRVLESMLIQVSPTDPASLLGASLVLVTAALLGCLFPAARAMRVDPAIALKYD
jgi:putative ABC transport system permease protein